MRKLALCTLLLTFAAVAEERGVFMEDIDRTANACTNFFDYANGAWRKANPIPASQSRWSRRWAAGEASKDQLKTIVDELSQRSDWPKGSVDQQIADFYGSCMDSERINARRLEPIKPYLDRISKISSRDDLRRAISDLHAVQINIPFGVTSTPDTRNPSSQVIAQVYATGLGMPDRDYYLKPDARFVEARAKYRDHVAKMLKLAGSTSPKSEADTVIAMETRLAEWHFNNVQLRDPKLTDHKHYLATLQAMTPHFDWKRHLAAANVEPQELNVDQPLFMQAVDRELATTPLGAWRTYLRWHVLDRTAAFLSDDFVQEDFAFNQFLTGAKEMKPRWKRCVEFEDRLLGEALGQKYVERYFSAVAKARMQEMVKNLLAAMGDTIRGLDWMGAATKQQALEKLATFNPKVGYPDKWIDYSSIAVSRDDFVQNVINASKFARVDDLSQIGKPIDRGRWGMTPPTSNAYYNPLLNEIVFPAGILQPPAFDVNAADAVNYGAIGVVIGHEISHGFDDQGSQFDAQGRLRNWWTDEDLTRFKAKTQCVVDQFEGYFVEPGIHHNGKLVLGESIGDLAGAKIAYLAFQKAQQTRPAKTIDGLTPDQQFFIGWGQFRGDEIRPEAQRTMVQRDPHPTGKYRVIGPLSNMPEFAKAFQCQAGAEMIRTNACEVW